jgi:hypothetical protein
MPESAKVSGARPSSPFLPPLALAREKSFAVSFKIIGVDGAGKGRVGEDKVVGLRRT